MKISLPLADMSVEDKLSILEEIWADLERDSDRIPSPAWHADVLAAREAALREGNAILSDWEEAKTRIRADL